MSDARDLLTRSSDDALLSDLDEVEEETPKGKKQRKWRGRRKESRRDLGDACDEVEPKSEGKQRRWRRKRGRVDEEKIEEEVNPATIPFVTPRGTIVRANSRRAHKGWYAPQTEGAPSTTRQTEILNTAVIAAPTDDEGIAIGRDHLSRSTVAHDPFTAYGKNIVSSPNVLVLGDVGGGKSSLLKTVYVLRPLILKRRRCVVIDKKDRAGEGEYAELARTFGTAPLKFNLDEDSDRTILNLLDPLILAGAGKMGQLRLISAIAEQAQGGTPLDKWEREGLRLAFHKTMADFEGGRTPVLSDLVGRLGYIPTDYDATSYRVVDGRVGLSSDARELVHQSGIGVRFLFNSLLDELSGIFDGETSKHVKLSDQLTVFDVSQLPEDGPSVSMVVSTVNVWLLGTLRRQRGFQTNFLAEEGWHLLGGPGGKVLKSNSKLSRGLGLSNIIALHKIADVPADSPAMAMIQESQTVHVYQQSRANDIAACVNLFNFQPSSAESLTSMPPGHHLLKIGSRAEIYVEHVRSELEVQLTNTDEGMVAARVEDPNDQ